MGVLCIHFAAAALLCLHPSLASADAAHKSATSPLDFASMGDFPDWQSWSELITLRDRKPQPLLFCALPKASSTLWKKLLLRASGNPIWNTTNHTLIHHPVLSDHDFVGIRSDRQSAGPALMPLRGRVPQALQNRSDFDAVFKAEDPAFLKAVIVRDPVTRLLSAFLDRCVEHGEWRRVGAQGPVSFEEAVGSLQRMAAETWIHDTHFRAQADTCGLRFVDYDIVGRMESLEADSQHILERAGLWESFGRSGWGPDGEAAFAAAFQPADNHRRAAHGTTRKVCDYYTPALLESVRRLYDDDFQRFGYSIAPWQLRCARAWRQKGRGSMHRRLRAL